uniref:Uncharacterized protein n=1 Tax=Rhizophora mucronata TaxID=61149 RepID=A0A2P2MZC8_RHIMU
MLDPGKYLAIYATQLAFATKGLAFQNAKIVVTHSSLMIQLFSNYTSTHEFCPKEDFVHENVDKAKAYV